MPDTRCSASVMELSGSLPASSATIESMIVSLRRFRSSAAASAASGDHHVARVRLIRCRVVLLLAGGCRLDGVRRDRLKLHLRVRPPGARAASGWNPS